MSGFVTGDIVARKSYGSDILFKVTDITKDGKLSILVLKGIAYRIQADAPESDLILQNEQSINNYNLNVKKVIDKKCLELESKDNITGLKRVVSRRTGKNNSKNFPHPGKVLHIDGDSVYLKACLTQYQKFNIEAVGKNIKECDQPACVYDLLCKHKPDILVLTGHDGYTRGKDNYLNIDNYKNSKYFIEGVKIARKYQPDLDNLVIFAGACQSMYGELIKSGANFASSPERVLIHSLDPVFVCKKIAYTGIEKTLQPLDVISATITGVKGIGGLQTRGKYRDGFPLEPYDK
ncbi:MAG: sporulation peptidase YabG [Bacillota bacterium]|nr:sporulation peptidase YabG [Bacillota bacterium]